MYRLKLDNVAVGQVIAEPVLSSAGALLCNPGTPMSRTLRSSLKKFGITHVVVQSIVSDTFDKSYLELNSLNNMSYMSIQNLDIDSAFKCSNVLVNRLLQDEAEIMLDVLLDYDDVTYQHSLNVASLSLLVGIKLGLSIKELRFLALGSLLHDIGKAGISSEILNKNGKLNDAEMCIMKMHPQIGYIMVDKIDGISTPVKQIILQHHENHDGTGYPKGLKDFHIYKLARLVHIVDVYEAMCAKRPYKDPMPRNYIKEFLAEEAGNKFDPIMLKKFLSVVPLYLIGEELEYDGIKGIVINTDNYEDPLISVGKDIIHLSDFQNTQYTKQKAYSMYKDMLLM